MGAGRRCDRGTRCGRGVPGPDPGPDPRRLGRTRLGRHAGGPPGAGPAEGQLPPQGAGAARAGGAGRGAAQGQRHRAGVPRHRRVLRDLPECPGRRQPGPRPVSRPAVRPLAAGAGVPAGAGGRGPADRRRPGAAAGRHVRHRRGGAVRLGGRTDGLRRGTGPGRGGPRRALPRRIRPGGPESPGGRRAPPDPRGAEDRIRSRTGELTMTHPFEIELETTLPATPEQVWAAIATGPGIDSWFMGRNEVEPRQGGALRMVVNDYFTAEATVTGWDPPRRFAYESAPEADGSFMAFEYLVEGRNRASTVVRL